MKINSLQSSLSVSQSELQISQFDVVELKSQNIILDNLISASNDEISRLRAELDSVNVLLQTANRENELKLAENFALNEQLKEIKSEKTVLREELANVQRNSRDIASKENVDQQLSEKLSVLHEQNLLLTQQNELILIERDDLQIQKTQLSDDFLKLKNGNFFQLENSNSRSKELSETIKFLNDEISVLKNENVKLVQQIESASFERYQKLSDNTQVLEELSYFGNETEKLVQSQQIDVSLVNDREEKLKEEVHSLRDENTRLAEQLELVSFDRDVQIKEKSHLSEEILNLKTEYLRLTQLDQKIKQYSDSEEKFRKDLLTLKDENSRLVEQLELISFDKDEQSNAISQLSEELSLLRNENVQLKQQSKFTSHEFEIQFKERTRRITEELFALKDENSSLLEQLDSVSFDRDEQINENTQLSGELSQLRSENAQLVQKFEKNSFSNEKKQVEDLTTEIAVLRQEKSQLQSSFFEGESKFNERIATLTDEILLLTNDNSRLNELLKLTIEEKKRSLDDLDLALQENN
ncbi:hypothetical protein HK096_009317, partial [Nowakowskiella sp. JEL0078]